MKRTRLTFCVVLCLMAWPLPAALAQHQSQHQAHRSDYAGMIIEKLFDPFFTTKPVGGGTGLGLSIGNEIVKRMNGRLTAENTGDGALFTVDLPLFESGSAADPS